VTVAPHRVAALAIPEVVAFDLAIPAQIFGHRDERDRYSFVVCAERPGRVPSTTGFAVEAPYGLDVLDSVDTVVVPGFDPLTAPPPAALDALRRARDRGVRIASVCVGAFALDRRGVHHQVEVGRPDLRPERVQQRRDVAGRGRGDQGELQAPLASATDGVHDPGARRQPGPGQALLEDLALGVVHGVGVDVLPARARVLGDAVAAAAGGQHLATRADLVRGAFTRLADAEHHVPTGDLRSDLIAELTMFRLGMQRHRLDRALAVLADLAASVPELAELRDHLVAEGEQVLRSLLAQVLTGPELEAAALMLSGAVLHSALMHGRLPDDAVITAAVDLVLRAAGTGPSR
jgi:putative intracellular protease/amidase